MYFRVLSVLIICVCLNSCASKKHLSSTSKPKETSFSDKLGCPLPVNYNKVFIEAITEWLGTPYSYGGNSKKGTDCSGFVQAVYKKVFNKIIEHNSLQISLKSRTIKAKELEQGDLLFFKINKKQIDHIGMHIFESYFIHASTKKGVIVSDLKQTYYKETFAFYGKIN